MPVAKNVANFSFNVIDCLPSLSPNVEVPSYGRRAAV